MKTYSLVPTIINNVTSFELLHILSLNRNSCRDDVYDNLIDFSWTSSWKLKIYNVDDRFKKFKRKNFNEIKIDKIYYGRVTKILLFVQTSLLKFITKK